ncbi:MAG: DUF2326 domain-containing protein [Tissierellia bacterium]|nr:DUF2326 domain-containing protein [Tissierellia bacterium]
MLKEIRCNLFKQSGKVRPPIVFNKGLNIILGSVPGKAGSIGKSTMLLIIDFVFGGNTYKKSDAVSQLGDHTIFFKFTFGNSDYHFARNTSDNIVARCDEKYNILDSIELNDFTNWLSQKYGMNLPGVQFRNTISRFFRIYGKNNFNEQRPLQVRGGSESQKDAIHILVALFNLYSSILVFEEQLKLADEKITAFREARRYQFIPTAVDGMKKYEENIESIASLKRKKHELISSENKSVNEKDVEAVNHRNDLERQLQDLRRVIRSYEDELHLLKLNVQQGIYPTEADLNSLQEFFPDVNLKKLIEIETFHNKIQVILMEELDVAITKVEEAITPLKDQEKNLLRDMDSIKPSQFFTNEFLDAYTKIDREINKLQDENSAFETRNQLQEEKRRANARYQEQMKSVLDKIENTINEEMEKISDIVTNDEYNAPKMTINKYDSYNFETPKDDGTGTNNRGLIIYDIAILNTTVLPAIAHDSLLFDSMSRPDLSKIIEIYSRENEKQIFVSLDKTNTCSKKAQEIIANNTVIKLDNDESCLFGAKWSKKERK